MLRPFNDEVSSLVSPWGRLIDLGQSDIAYSVYEECDACTDAFGVRAARKMNKGQTASQLLLIWNRWETNCCVSKSYMKYHVHCSLSQCATISWKVMIQGSHRQAVKWFSTSRWLHFTKPNSTLPTRVCTHARHGDFHLLDKFSLPHSDDLRWLVVDSITASHDNREIRRRTRNKWFGVVIVNG